MTGKIGTSARDNRAIRGSHSAGVDWHRLERTGWSLPKQLAYPPP